MRSAQRGEVVVPVVGRVATVVDIRGLRHAPSTIRTVRAAVAVTLQHPLADRLPVARQLGSAVAVPPWLELVAMVWARSQLRASLLEAHRDGGSRHQRSMNWRAALKRCTIGLIMAESTWPMSMPI